ncbi:bacteriocin [Aquimarina sp. 2304DJ70-9]
MKSTLKTIEKKALAKIIGGGIGTSTTGNLFTHKQINLFMRLDNTQTSP